MLWEQTVMMTMKSIWFKWFLEGFLPSTFSWDTTSPTISANWSNVPSHCQNNDPPQNHTVYYSHCLNTSLFMHATWNYNYPSLIEVEGDPKAPFSLASTRGEGMAPFLSLVFPVSKLVPICLGWGVRFRLGTLVYIILKI